MLAENYPKYKNSTIEFRKSGKPYIEDGPYFNISHSKDFVALAVSSSLEVGIDIEYIDSKRNTDGLMKEVGSPEELLHYKGLAKEDKAGYFYKLWALKESCIKCSESNYTEEVKENNFNFCSGFVEGYSCLLYTSPSPRDATLSRMPSSA